MQRHSASTDCARPLCAIRATVRFWFDGAERRVVLDRKVSEWGGQGLLCETHADRLIVARGWELDDRRVAEPRLFPVNIGDRTAASRVRRLAQPEAHPSTPLPLDGGPLYALPSDYETPPPAPLSPMPTGAPRSGSDSNVPGRDTNSGGLPDSYDSDDSDDSADSADSDRTDDLDDPERTDDSLSEEHDDADRSNDSDHSGRSSSAPKSDRSRSSKSSKGSKSSADSGESNRDDSDHNNPTPPARTRPISAKPRRRSHTEGNTPLLTRAFEAAASRVRASSTLESLIPRNPPIPEPASSTAIFNSWSSARYR